MNTLIIDIRETSLRAVLSADGVLEYCRTFDFEPLAPVSLETATNEQESKLKHAPAADNPYLIYYDIEDKSPWDLALKQIVTQIRSDIKSDIDSTHLIIPSDEVTMVAHQLPKMARADAEKLIARKLTVETKEEFPPFAIIPSLADQKTQTWYSLYIPTATLKDYQKAFATSRMRLTSITTPVNAMIDAFRGVREAIFNAHAIFEIQRGYIEAFYISADGILHFQRQQYTYTTPHGEANSEEADKSQKQKIFNILNSIFSINSLYQSTHKTTPVQMAWVCGLESGLDDIATALKEAMGIEVGIAPVIPTGLPDESSYVPLAGYAAALQSNSATSYAPADFFRRFPLRKTSGLIIYAVTTTAALLAYALTEMDYQKLRKQAKPQVAATGKPGNSALPANNYAKNIDAIKKLTTKQLLFYPLFRDLASNLPDSIYLDNFEFHLKGDKATIDITAQARLDDKLPESMVLTRFVTMLDQSAILKKHREPNITVSNKDKERSIKITVSSEVNPFDTTK